MNNSMKQGSTYEVNSFCSHCVLQRKNEEISKIYDHGTSKGWLIRGSESCTSGLSSPAESSGEEGCMVADLQQDLEKSA